MNPEGPIDLGDLGLSMAFYGMMTALASLISEIIISVIRHTESSDLRYYSLETVSGCSNQMYDSMMHLNTGRWSLRRFRASMAFRRERIN